MQPPDPADLERVLDALGPVLAAEDMEASAAHATRLLAALARADATVMFLVAGKDTGAEFWVPGDDDTRQRFRPHLRGLALEALAHDAPVVAPFPPEIAQGLVPGLLPLCDRGRVVAMACFAGAPDSAERCAGAGPFVARQLASQEAAGRLQTAKDRYERWFRRFDQQMRALERERQKFAALVNQPGIYVFSLDLTGTVRWTSRTLATRCPTPDPAGWTGRSAGDLWSRLFDGDPPERPFEEAWRTGQPAQRDFGCCGSGRAGYHVSVLPIREPDGRVSEVLVMMQDLQLLRAA